MKYETWSDVPREIEGVGISIPFGKYPGLKSDASHHSIGFRIYADGEYYYAALCVSPYDIHDTIRYWIDRAKSDGKHLSFFEGY